MEYFTRADIEGSDRAHDLQQLLGWPSDQQLINVLSKKLIINCPVLSDNVRRAHAIYGPVTTLFKGGGCEEEAQTCLVKTTHSHSSVNS